VATTLASDLTTLAVMVCDPELRLATGTNCHLSGWLLDGKLRTPRSAVADAPSNTATVVPAASELPKVPPILGECSATPPLATFTFGLITVSMTVSIVKDCGDAGAKGADAPGLGLDAGWLGLAAGAGGAPLSLLGVGAAGGVAPAGSAVPPPPQAVSTRERMITASCGSFLERFFGHIKKGMFFEHTVSLYVFLILIIVI